MIKTVVLVLLIVTIGSSLTFAQTSCNQKQITKEFLETISSPKYKSSINDFHKYFDVSAEEPEEGLRSDYLKNNPRTQVGNKSFVIEKVIENQTMRALINTSVDKNSNWVISKPREYGLTIIYVVTVENSKDSIQVKTVNLPQENRCGIVDILDSKSKSFIY